MKKLYIIAENKVTKKEDYGSYVIVCAENASEALHKLAEYYRTDIRKKWYLKDCKNISSDDEVVKACLAIQKFVIKEIKEDIWEGEIC